MLHDPYTLPAIQLTIGIDISSYSPSPNLPPRTFDIFFAVIIFILPVTRNVTFDNMWWSSRRRVCLWNTTQFNICSHNIFIDPIM
jgi:hypothetical protein